MVRRASPRSSLVRLGFVDPVSAADRLDALPGQLTGLFADAADPDRALAWLVRMLEDQPEELRPLLEEPDTMRALVRVLGASEALAEFLHRHPGELDALRPVQLPSASALTASLREAVGDRRGPDAVDALRVRYRRELTSIAAWDLAQDSALAVLDAVAACLADLAGATIDAALDLARRESRADARELERTRLAIIGMGKAGARELNYVSDVDVIYVAEGEGEVTVERAVELATALARRVTAIVHGASGESPLWELDANLRPEGRDGALVRSLASHVAYYERWAKAWEFQALLKARPLAGDRELGERYIEALAPLVWSSASSETFVESVQRMRERVTESIPASERDVQLKLGAGGLRDIEFTVQLLQLVHGQSDERVRQRDTLGALAALAEHGYISRAGAEEFSHCYRVLRLLEHRLQLARLSRTHLMPRDTSAVRVLARATGLARDADGLLEQWRAVATQVRGLHERLFYRPLLSAVAALPEEGLALSSEQAAARLASVGFADPGGALRHIAALTAGLSRRAMIQRNLLPVLLEWFAEGPDPDHGLLTFRRVSERLGQSPWYLRMLRDSSLAARRLTRLLAGSRYVGELFLGVPESVAWLEDDAELVPRGLDALMHEIDAIVRRHRGDPEAASAAVRTARRREILRTAIADILGLLSVEQVGHALTDVTTATIRGVLGALRPESDGIEFAVIALGRYGGEELGFGSDADVLYVCRPLGDAAAGRERAEQLVQGLSRLTRDMDIPLDLDASLRPEGRNGPLVRTLDAYRAYYERWSLTWEAQALLRARGVAGDERLLADFTALADGVRYPVGVSDHDVRDVKRIKARVEAERLPQGADPTRHLKLGRGSLSDVEWLAQLLQLQHASRIDGLRTTSTLGALRAARDAGLLDAADAEVLREAWLTAARCRSALTLWSGRTSDVLPRSLDELEPVARLVGYPPRSASALENDYLRATRRARAVFERLFYGEHEG